MGGGETSAPGTRPSWFSALMRLWCLRKIDAEPRGNPVAAIAVLSISWLAAWVIIDRWQRQPNPEFSLDGIPLLAWYAPAILSLAGLLSCWGYLLHPITLNLSGHVLCRHLFSAAPRLRSVW